MTPLLLAILGYVALQIVIGCVVSRQVHSEADYLVAGRRLGYPLAIFSIFATWFGAETCIGAAGGVYEEGLAVTVQDPFGYGTCLLFMGLVFAAPLWRRKLLTLADLFRQRYSAGVERVASLIMIPTSILWAAAQLRAFGQILHLNADGLDLEQAVALATVATLIYTVVGGLLADAWTDLLQGALLMSGLVVLLVAVLAAQDDPWALLRSVPAERLRLRGADEGLLSFANRWAIPVVGSVVAQELIARVSASRSAVVARRATLAAALTYLLFGAIPIVLGLLAPALLAAPAAAEQVLPAVARQYLSSVPYVLFVGVLVSAILSTVDSALLVAGSLASHNLAAPALRVRSDRRRLLLARLFVVLFGVVAAFLAVQSESVLELVEEASGCGSQGIFVIAVFGLFTGLGGRVAAYAALLLGMAGWIVTHHLLALEGDFLLALGLAGAGFLLGACLPGLARTRRG